MDGLTNFYMMSPMEVVSSPLFRAALVLVSSSSEMKMPFTAHQREGTFTFPFPFIRTPRKAPSPKPMPCICTRAPGNGPKLQPANLSGPISLSCHTMESGPLFCKACKGI